MSLLNIFNSKQEIKDTTNDLKSFLDDFSVEVMPRTAAKIDSFEDLLPSGARVYVAHLEGVKFNEMLHTAKRLKNEGFEVIPHFPARIIKDKLMLEDWISKYQSEANVNQALLLAGGISKPYGAFENSMQLVETELFNKYEFENLYFAGHPEGNKDIDPDGSSRNVDDAVLWKQNYNERTDIKLALTTQFCFEANPVIRWANELKKNGVDIPIHIGVAGPAKLQTLIKFSIACGVGPSLKVLQKRAKDVTKLLLPFEPDIFLEELALYKQNNPSFNITNIHFFPLGGIKSTANWIKNARN